MLADNLIQYLSDNHNIKSGINEDINSIRDAIYNRDADYILIIPEDLHQPIMYLLTNFPALLPQNLWICLLKTLLILILPFLQWELMMKTHTKIL